MAINKSKGNMYPDVKTWNGMYGICDHNCLYCYNRIHWSKWSKMRLNEKALKDKLGSGNFYFVGSSCDMFAEHIPIEWIKTVLEHCRRFNNKYLFQTKNPKRMIAHIKEFPNDTIFGTTIETNKDTTNLSKAPNTYTRKEAMKYFISNRTMVSIEPIMDFDLDIMIRWMKEIEPKYISIGADSRNCKLPEPSEEKLKILIKELNKFTEVKIKDNLRRLGDFTPNGVA